MVRYQFSQKDSGWYIRKFLSFDKALSEEEISDLCIGTNTQTRIRVNCSKCSVVVGVDIPTNLGAHLSSNPLALCSNCEMK